jgi:LmbE family N-acetylglucosaminyl deacetylase
VEKRAIVINPHDDDGVIAIGGTLIQLIEKGWKVKYIQLTDGRHGSNIMSPEDTIRARAAEIKKEMKFLGIDSYLNFYFEDGHLSEEYKSNRRNLQGKLAKVILSYEPLVVFIPSECEDHSDHRAAYELAHDVMDGIDLGTMVEIRYSVWSIPFKEHKPAPFEKLIAVDISEQMKKKKQAIRLHESQEKEGQYSKMADAVNSYLGMLYSAYRPYRIEKAEILAVTKLNEYYPIFEKDLSNVKDVTKAFHGRFSEKIET